MVSSGFHALATGVKTALASELTCDARTLERLKSLLNPSPSPKATNEDNSRKPTVQKSSARPGRAGRIPRGASKTSPGIAVLEVKDDEQPNLSKGERTRLATEVINVTLKSLTEAVKLSLSKGSRPKPKEHARVSSEAQCEKTVKHEFPKPLQTRNPNCVPQPSSDCFRQPRSSLGVSNCKTQGVVVLAECASVALATLRASGDLETTKRTLTALQLDMGASALIRKLIALDLCDLAVKELRILAKRLDMGSQIKPANGKRGLKSCPAETSQTFKQTLADCLRIEAIPADREHRSLVIAVQLHILRILGQRKRSTSIESAFEHLENSKPCSPQNLIVSSIIQDSQQSKDKAAGQLDSLAKAIFSLCPSALAGEDDTAHGPRSISPDFAFRFQVIALQILWKSWSLSNHTADLQKQLLDPFSKFLEAFLRRSKVTIKSKYQLAKQAIQWLYSLEAQVKPFLNQAWTSSCIAYFKELSGLAREQHDFTDAVRWMTKSQTLIEHGELSQSKGCSLTCQIGVTIAQAGFDEYPWTEVQSIVQKALEQLKGELQGTSKELDELLISLASLRKSLLPTLVELGKREQPDDDLSREHQKTLFEFMTQNLSFLARYLGTAPEPSTTSGSGERYGQRLALVFKVFDQTVDGVVLLTRLPLTRQPAYWKSLDRALQDAARLALKVQQLGIQKDVRQSTKSPKHSILVRISNSYWSYYLNQKERGSLLPELQSTLSKSIDVLQNSPVAEQEEGFLVVKLERLGNLFESCGEWKKASKVFQQALRILYECGAFGLAAEKARSVPLSQLFTNEPRLEVLCRVLKACSRLFTQSEVAVQELLMNPFTDSWKAPERGLFLEIHFAALACSLNASAAQPFIKSSMLKLAESIMFLYAPDVCPLRRLRTKVRILNTHLLDCSIFDQHFINSLSNEEMHVDLFSDTGLGRYRKHWKAQADSSFAILNPCSRLGLLRSALDTWSEFVRFPAEQRLTALQGMVDDVPDWILHLESIADCLQAQGFDNERVSVLTLISSIQQSGTPFTPTACVSVLSSLGLQLIRLGYSGKAGVALQKIRRYLAVETLPDHVLFQWHLTYGEYLLAIGHVVKNEEVLEQAHSVFSSSVELSRAKPSTVTERYRQVCMGAELMHLLSLTASAHGQSTHALFYGRKGAKLAHRAWALLERRTSGRSNTRQETPQGEVDNLSEDLSNNLSLRTPVIPSLSTKHDSLKTAPFWSLAYQLIRQLTRLGELLAHEGLISEAQYYVDQACKVADALQSRPFQASVAILQSDVESRAGKLEKAHSGLNKARDLLEGLPPSLLNVKFNLALARIHVCTRDAEQEEVALKTAMELHTTALTWPSDQELVASKTLDDDIGSKLQVLSLNKKSREPAVVAEMPTSRTANKGRASKKPIQQTIACRNNESVQCLPLLRQQAFILRQQSYNRIRINDFETAASCLKEAAQHILHVDGNFQSLANASLFLQQASHVLYADPVFSLLQDSTISCPSTGPGSRRQSEDMTRFIPLEINHSGPERRGRARPVVKESKCGSSGLGQRVGPLLFKCYETLMSIHSTAQNAIPCASLHSFSSVLYRNLMTLSAASLVAENEKPSSAVAAYALELGRSTAFMRASSALAAEKLLSTDQDIASFGLKELQSELPAAQINVVTFQEDFIDVIPDSWTAISISVTDDHGELRLSRLRAGQPPFILAIPLNRHNSRDCEEDVFGFDQGKTELANIVDLANYSTHDAGDMSKKGAKTAWWEARAALDARLKNLLINIENIWLGGFRGIFSQHIPRHDLLSRFQQSFYNILNKHLPSRRRGGKQAKSGKVTLDSRVLELFVCLGRPGDVEDIEEPLTDLLYFVVDILQFHGERNAYDEIDFDPIIIEVIDALSHYHDRVQEDWDAQQADHTVLILDKFLHCFPWESLPCLAGKAVSRLPSLTCLRERVLRQNCQSSNTDIGKAGIYINATNGAYILNPAGDLTTTQSTFTPPLSSLTSWSATIARVPTEPEITAHLSSRDLYLYFGHGSGGQYVRSRTIRKLDRCAVALLMGCSSGTMTEAGEFESYGTPLNYLHGGAAAVVGTLWDVTDKDIDRFSLKVLERWGLVEEEGGKAKRMNVEESPVKVGRSEMGSPVKRGRRAKGKAAVKEEVAECRSKVGLDQAVGEAREACIMKYLNGAAPVVYGVPVFLS